MNLTRSVTTGISLILASLILLSACRPDRIPPLPEKKRTELHLLNLYPGVSSVDVYFENSDSDVQVAKDIRFQQSWPSQGYASLLFSPEAADSTGAGAIFFRVVNNMNGKVLFPNQQLLLLPGVRTSMFLIEIDSALQYVTTLDQIPATNDTSCNIRFLNLNPQVASATLKSSDESILLSNINYLNYSLFESERADIYDISIKNDFTGAVLHTATGQSLQKGKTYSFYLAYDGFVPVGGYELLD
jgi:hypothetical protein